MANPFLEPDTADRNKVSSDFATQSLEKSLASRHDSQEAENVDDGIFLSFFGDLILSIYFCNECFITDQIQCFPIPTFYFIDGDLTERELAILGRIRRLTDTPLEV